MPINNHFESSPEVAMRKLISGNEIYLQSRTNPANISTILRRETAHHGQRPYAVILTCSDSRVPPEHIFSAGIGNLFVVRTTGNVVGDFELGSVEYAVKHLGASVVVIMGHSHCGAVVAALEGRAHGNIDSVVKEIQAGLNGATTEQTAILNNIDRSKNRIMESKIIRSYVRSGEVMLVPALYRMDSGKVDFLQ